MNCWSGLALEYSSAISVSVKVVRTSTSGASSMAASMLARLVVSSIDSKVFQVPPWRSAARLVPTSPRIRKLLTPIGLGVT